MKIYVAGPFIHKKEANEVANDLRKAGFDVVSRWHNNPYESNEQTDEVLQQEALKDFTDIGQANVLVYLNLAKSEGKATELGIGLTRTIPIYVLGGKANNVFLHLSQIRHRGGLEEVIKELHASRS